MSRSSKIETSRRRHGPDTANTVYDFARSAYAVSATPYADITPTTTIMVIVILIKNNNNHDIAVLYARPSANDECVRGLN